MIALRYPATQINLIWPQAHCTHTCGDVTDFVASADSLRWQGGICQQQSGVSCNSESICKQSQVPRSEERQVPAGAVVVTTAGWGASARSCHTPAMSSATAGNTRAPQPPLKSVSLGSLKASKSMVWCTC
ncbi:uncharacterized protein LOC135106643 [Scylla paramamosain]|uniref:uncharacterized protein LOC135104709 n=1 Tax=Scylla paramamosain TaxID=85552 RepID=UPI0030839513